MRQFFLPLSGLLPENLIPSGLLEIEANQEQVLEQVGIYDYEVRHQPGGVFFRADFGLAPGISGEPELALAVPQSPGLGLVLRRLGRLEVWFEEDFRLRISLGACAIRIPLELLRPVKEDADGKWIADLGRTYVEIEVSFASFAAERPEAGRDYPIVLTVDRDGRIELDYPFSNADGETLVPQVSLNGPAMVGETGVVFEAEEIRVSFDPDDPVLTFGRAALRLSSSLVGSLVLPDILFENATLSRRGFSGTVNASWPLDFVDGAFVYRLDGGHREAKLLGLEGGLRFVGARIEQNQLTACDINGAIIIPYFGKPADVRISILPDGSLTVTLLNMEPDKPLTKDGLLALYLESLEVEKDAANNVSLVVSGGLQPLLQSSDGLGWPRLDVKELRIDSRGKLSIREAWLDLTERKPLDLYGFSLDLDRIGLGVESAGPPAGDRFWIDLSGSLRLLPQIPVGLGVEGFRLSWPMNLDQVFHDHTGDPLELALAISEHVEVQFKGVQLFFGVPDAIEFEGLIRFFKSAEAVGFAGDVALRVPATGFGAEAGLLVGMTFREPIYPFLYVTLAVDLPAGIPLGQSGLALKGAQGMFGINVRPDRDAAQNWYHDWYKRAPVGAHPATKWTNEPDALAFGVGVTITTVDGYVKGTRGLLVLSLPGPVLMIEGRALLLSGLKPGEPPLRALAVFDGNAKTVQFNVEAQAELIEDMLDAYGGLEAFFDFNHVTNWHLYLGQDEPRDRRIRANVLELFKADAYLMLDMVNAGTLRSRMGVFAGFKPPIDDIGPLHVTFDATLEGDGLVTVRPEQFSGDAALSAAIGLSAFGFSAQLSARAAVSAEGPIPLQVATEVKVRADLPAPLDPLEHTFEFSWQSTEIPEVVSPLTGIAVNSRFAPSGGGFSPDAGEGHRIHVLEDVPGSTWRQIAEKSPVVPVDAESTLAFGQVMNSRHFARHPSGNRPTYSVGPLKFTPRLVKVGLFEHKKSEEWWTGWESVAASGDAGRPLPGVWLAESDPQSPEAPAPRRLQLGTDNPLIHSGRASGSGSTVWSDRRELNLALANRLLEDYPELMRPEPEAIWTCVRFDDADGVTILPGGVWQHHGLRFDVPVGRSSFTVRQHTARAARGKGQPVFGWLWNWLFPRRTMCHCLEGGKSASIEIRFPALVREVRVRFCGIHALPTSMKEGRVVTTRRPRTLKEVGSVLGEAGKAGSRPGFQSCTVPVPVSTTASGDTWVVSAGDGFHCLLIEMQDKGIAIREICYLTVAEAERADRSREEAQDNTALPFLQQTNLLKPGRFYRLEVTTEVDGAIDFDGFLPSGWLGEAMEEAYRLAAAALGFDTRQDDPTRTWPFTQAIFFQTEGPPANLRPYTKWSSPGHQAERVFCDNNIVVRFLRANVHAMCDAPSGVRIQVRDAQGKSVDLETLWDTALSATRFPEEDAWERHRTDVLGLPARQPPRDDRIVAKLGRGTTLRPKTRYVVEIRRTDRPASDETGLLHAFTFTTSAFESFTHLLKSFAGPAVELVGQEGAQAAVRAARLSARGQMAALASKELRWQHDLMDFRSGALVGGREALEESSLARREARAAHDAAFRETADALAAGVYYQPFGGRVECQLVKDPGSARVVCVWIRSPESLDLRLPVAASGDPAPGEWVGRTEVSVSSPSLSTPLKCVALGNGDGTQLLLFPVETPDWASGMYTLQFTYHRDHGDETRDGDHRYDRPVEMSGGRSGDVVAEIAVTL